MSVVSALDFAAIGSIFLLAGAVKGVLGLGLPTVAIGLLGLLMPVAQAAALLTVPSFVTNVWQAAAGAHLVTLVRRLWPMQLGLLIGVLSGAGLMRPEHASAASLLLGACLMLYGIAGLAGLRFPRPAARFEPTASALVGCTTGLVTAATGVFVLPAVPYMQALGLDKDEMAQALGLSFTVSTIALAWILASAGTLDGSAALHSSLALAPALAGMALGQKLRGRLSQDAFRRTLFAGLIALGAWLVLKQL